MRVPPLLHVLVLAGSLAWPAVAGEAAFAQQPSATAVADGLRIDFAVTAATDAEVTILDAKGGEVCHLAAGRLGEAEAAPPLRAAALAQSLLWNRNDDRGRAVPASAGPFRARVRLGLRADGARVIAVVPRDLGALAKADFKPAEPFAPGRAGLSSEELTSKEGQAIAVLNSWTVEADKEDDRLYLAPYGLQPLVRYLGRSGALETVAVPAKAKATIFGLSVAANGDLVWSPYLRYNRDLVELPPPPGMSTHPSIKSHNYGNIAYQKARPIHEYWSGTIGIEGLDGRAYHRSGYQIPYQRITVWDTWERDRGLIDGFQKSVSVSIGRSHASCLRADTKGFLYIAQFGGPADRAAPANTVKVGGGYGTIIKIDIAKRWEDDFVFPYAGKPTDPEEAKGAVPWSAVKGEYLTRFERLYPYCMSNIQAGCNCKGPHFDLDEHGRLYVPDLQAERVRVLDNAGNEILALQGALAAETAGAGARLQLAWPHRLAASRRAIYVGDPVNSRVLRIALGWQAEAVCTLP